MSLELGSGSPYSWYYCVPDAQKSIGCSKQALQLVFKQIAAALEGRVVIMDDLCFQLVDRSDEGVRLLEMAGYDGCDKIQAVAIMPKPEAARRVLASAGRGEVEESLP